MKIKRIAKNNLKTTSRTTMNISSLSSTTSINANTDVVLDNDITIDNVNEYLNLIGDNITIDGQGYTITVTVPNYPGFIKNGTSSSTAPCKNLTIKNINVAVSGSGSLAEYGGWIGQRNFGARINGGIIVFENCSSTGSIGTDSGGISGYTTGIYMINSTITFSNCYSTGTIGKDGPENDAGGICGYGPGFSMNNSTITFNNCYSTGAIGQWAGGISGEKTGRYMSNSTITFNNCYSTGAIGYQAGGISGQNTGANMTSSTITVNNCYTTGTIGEDAGGISGQYTGYQMTSSTITVNNCYTIGNIGTNAGGIYGNNKHSSATHSNCIFVGGVSSGFSASSSQTAGTWIDANALITIGTSTTNNDVTDVWGNKTSGSAWIHIVLGCTDSNAFNYDASANTDDGSCNKIDNSTFSGSTIDIPPSSNVELTEDITIDSVNEFLDLTGNNITIDGKGHTITVTVADYPGFIKNGDSTNALCANCEIKNINVATSGDGSLVEYGGWIGQLYFGSSIDGGNILFENCSSSGAIANNAGGISGERTGFKMANSIITFNNCYSTGTISEDAGGISGGNTGFQMTNSTITLNNCYSTGSIGKGAGGIYGEYTGYNMSNSTITSNNCYTIGSIGTDAGGILGKLAGYDMSNSTVTESNCITSASDEQTAGTWIDANALITIGTSTTDNNISNVWYNPDASSAWTHRTSGQTGIIAGCTDVNAFNYDTTANTDDGSCVDKVFGCMDSNAFNYDTSANTDDGSCTFVVDNPVFYPVFQNRNIIRIFNQFLSDFESVVDTLDKSQINFDKSLPLTGNDYIDSKVDGGNWQNWYTLLVNSADSLYVLYYYDNGVYNFLLANESNNDCTTTNDINRATLLEIKQRSDGQHYFFIKLELPGCMDSNAFNYDASANIDDGSCVDKVLGCMDINYIEYDASVNTDDGTCSTLKEYTKAILYNSDDNPQYNYKFTLKSRNSDLNILDFYFSWPPSTMAVAADNNASLFLEILDNDNNSLSPPVIYDLTDTASIVIRSSSSNYISLSQFANGHPIVNSINDINLFNVNIDDKYGGSFDGFTNFILVNSNYGIIINFSIHEPKPGCMDTNAFNYDSNANTDDGSCVDKVLGCMDVNASNYDSNANTDDESCTRPTSETILTIDTYATSYGGQELSGDPSIHNLNTVWFGEYKFEDIGNTGAITIYNKQMEFKSYQNWVTVRLSRNDGHKFRLKDFKYRPEGLHKYKIKNPSGYEIIVSDSSSSNGNPIHKNLLNNNFIFVDYIDFIVKSQYEDEDDWTKWHIDDIILIGPLSTEPELIQLDQINDQNTIGFSGSESQWQSFTVGKKGILYKLQCKMRNPLGSGANESDVKLSLYSGEGIEGTLLAESSELKTPKSGEDWVEFIVINSNINVDIGQKYTIRIEVPYVSQAFLPWNMNGYSGGNNGQEFFDFFFKTFITTEIEPEIEPEPVTGVINYCNDPDACNYLEEGDCKELDCAGICGGEAYKDENNNCIISKKI